MNDASLVTREGLDAATDGDGDVGDEGGDEVDAAESDFPVSLPSLGVT